MWIIGTLSDVHYLGNVTYQKL